MVENVAPGETVAISLLQTIPAATQLGESALKAGKGFAILMIEVPPTSNDEPLRMKIGPRVQVFNLNTRPIVVPEGRRPSCCAKCDRDGRLVIVWPRRSMGIQE
jgi:hypothetical protein